MKELKLTKGMVTLVDDEDYELVSNHKWQVSQEGRNGQKWYAIRWSKVSEHGKGNRRFKIRLHRVLMGLTRRDTEVVDHLNGDSLDNQKANLEVVTQEENMRRAPGYFKRKVECFL